MRINRRQSTGYSIRARFIVVAVAPLLCYDQSGVTYPNRVAVDWRGVLGASVKSGAPCARFGRAPGAPPHLDDVLMFTATRDEASVIEAALPDGLCVLAK